MTSYSNCLVDFKDWRHAVLRDVSGSDDRNFAHA